MIPHAVLAAISGTFSNCSNAANTSMPRSKSIPTAVLTLYFVLHTSLCVAESVRINKIAFNGNRTSENTLRTVIPIKEGGELTQQTLEKTYDALYAMKLFKSVEISTSAAGEGLADVSITAKDGWYLFPLPFAVSGQGGGSAGLLLLSRNIFRGAESISVSGMTGGTGGAATLFLEKGGRSLNIFHSERSAEEGFYTDGAFSSVQNMRKSDNSDFFSKYGTLAALYKRRQQTNSIFIGFTVLRRGNMPALSGKLSYTGEKNTYNNGQQEPRGGGRTSRVSLEINAGGLGEKMDDMGVIFGMGLADMNKRLQQRTKTENRWGGGLSVSNAGAWTGSDYAFSKAALSLVNSTAWGRENRLSLRCAAALSANAPENQLLATGRETGLMGQYAREFRAPRMTSFNASFSKPILRSKRGILQAAVFTETAFDPADYSATVQKGAGFSLYYRFWRFPLPLGFSQTYSLRDKNMQVSAAIGGQF